MNVLKSMTAIAALAIATGASGADDTSSQTPSPYFDELIAKLISEGYRDIRIVDAENNRLIAWDWNGSEIMLVAHPSNRTILSALATRKADQ